MIAIFQNIINSVKSLFKKQPQTTSDEAEQNNKFAQDYNDPKGINIYAMVANKIAAIVVSESTVTVDGNNKRAIALNSLLESFITKKWKDATADSAGNGGIVIIPNYVDGVIGEDVIPQNRVVVNNQHNGVWKDVVVIVDIQILNDVPYYLLRNMVIAKGIYTESYRVTKGSLNGTEVPMQTIPKWANIMPLTPSGKGIAMDRLPLAFAKCPASDRNMGYTKGVPITYGQDKIIDVLKKILCKFEKEIDDKDSRLMVSDLYLDFDKNKNKYSLKEQGIFTVLTGISGNEKYFDMFDPQFRDGSFIQMLDAWYKMLERGICVSEGFFSQSKAAAITATEVDAKNHDTYVVQSAFQTMWENAFTDLIYAYDVIMNYYGITPSGEYKIQCNWSHALIENKDVSFNQQIQAHAIGSISTAEVRQRLKPSETIEESQKAVDEIKMENEEPEDEFMPQEVGY